MALPDPPCLNCGHNDSTHTRPPIGPRKCHAEGCHCASFATNVELDPACRECGHPESRHPDDELPPLTTLVGKIKPVYPCHDCGCKNFVS